MSTLKDKLRPYYKALRFQLNGAKLEFEAESLPWIDRPDADIDGFLKTFPVPVGYPYDLKEKLQFWRENGYVILEKALPGAWLDGLWAEVEGVLREPQKHRIRALVDGVNNNKETQLENIPVGKIGSLGARLIEYHNSSVGAKNVLAHPNLVTFLRAVLGDDLALLQSLIFKFGSQQGVHQDFPWVRSNYPSHMAAVWIPVEDVHPDSGPLFYYPGSHRIPKFNFGTGILYRDTESLRSPAEFEQYLTKTCEGQGLQKKTLLLKKGDVLFWHAALAHGGGKIANPALSRKSFVVHYSTTRSYPRHRWETGESTPSENVNGITIYANPENLAQENSLTGGKDW